MREKEDLRKERGIDNMGLIGGGDIDFHSCREINTSSPTYLIQTDWSEMIQD